MSTPACDLDASPRCLNCAQPLARPPLPYCPHCGQESRLRTPTVMEFLQQFGGAYLSTEGALWRSLWLLLTRPGELTRQYLAGRRRHYVLPLRLYLTISVITLLAMKINGGLVIEQQGGQAALDTGPDMSLTVVDLGQWQAGLRQGKFYCEGMPHSMCLRLQQRLSTDKESMALQLQQGKDRFMNHWGTAMFVLVPLFAVWLKLLYWDKRRHYTEHLVCALHLHAFWFAMLLLIQLGLAPLSLIALCASLVYPLIALQRVYATRWWSTALRTLMLALLNFTSISFALVAVLLLTLLA
jgi:hypothetical protein